MIMKHIKMFEEHTSPTGDKYNITSKSNTGPERKEYARKRLKISPNYHETNMEFDKFGDFLVEHKLHKSSLELINYIQGLSNRTFVFVDTETTGLGGHKKQQLTQISAIAYDYDFVQNKFNAEDKFNNKIKISSDMKQRLSDPDDNIRKIFKFNRYGDKIQDDPSYYDELQTIKIFKDWLKKFDNAVLVMQNAKFDMNMICGRGKDRLKNEVLDTKQIIQLFIIPITEKLAETDTKSKETLDKIGTSERDFGLINSSMSKWGPYFGINMSGYHDALSDCNITSQMFLKMIDYIKDNIDLDIDKYQKIRINTTT